MIRSLMVVIEAIIITAVIVVIAIMTESTKGNTIDWITIPLLYHTGLNYYL